MALFQSTHPRRVWHSLNAKWEKGGSFNPHTHAGCDEEIWRRLYVQSCFNPHTHAGCDQKKWTVLTIKNSFNPHTHAGCDIVWYSLLTRQKSFNPHTHAGCDHGRLYAICQLILFQSTHPRRVWRSVRSLSARRKSFNPHTHAGCDNWVNLNGITGIVSIHTPTQGVTLYLITYYKSANLIHCYANHHYYSTS